MEATNLSRKELELLMEVKGFQLRCGYILLKDADGIAQGILPLNEDMCWELGIDYDGQLARILGAFKAYLDEKARTHDKA